MARAIRAALTQRQRRLKRRLAKTARASCFDIRLNRCGGQSFENQERAFFASRTNLIVRAHAAWTAGLTGACSRERKSGVSQFALAPKQGIALADAAGVVVVEKYIRFEERFVLGGIVKNRYGQVARIGQ
jgi:hypothetical protein